MGKKKFVDKKSSATYAIVCADSNDTVGDSSSSHVFVRVGGGAACVPGIEANDPADIVDTVAEWGTGAAATNRSAINGLQGTALSPDARAEIEACGFPDDGYNYLQHLRTIDGHGSFVPAIKSGVPSLRPDIRVDDARVAASSSMPAVRDHEDAMASDSAQGYTGAAVAELTGEALEDEQFMNNFSDDTGDELDDDFVVRANGMVSIPAVPKTVGICVKEFPGRSDSSLRLQDGERPSRRLDLQFEKLVLREYDDDCFDGPDSECSGSEGLGTPDGGSPRISLQKDDASELLLSGVCGALPATLSEDQGSWRSALSAAVKRCVVSEGMSVTDAEAYSTDGEFETEMGRAWDCDTIVLTLSNLDNHPATIEDPLRSKKLQSVLAGALRLGKGMCPPNTDKRDLPSSTNCKDRNTALRLSTAKSHADVQEQVDSSTSPTITPSRQSRKEHKVAVKQARREARVAKKALKVQYRDDRAQAQHVAAHGMIGALRL